MVTLSALTSRFRRPLRTHPWHWLLGGWASSLILLWLWKLLTQTHISWLDAWQLTQVWLWLLLGGMALFFYCRRPRRVQLGDGLFRKPIYTIVQQRNPRPRHSTG